ncbi:MAG: cytochrome c oxidase subunit II [Limnobacter sp.]|jgi:cytochrome c oxidase subunit II|uniref:Cytochrome c oxidase subunit 2 n=2 Tax=Burkholderiaceae TaxID=119060 RepID=A0ABX6N8R3_9BURK|nr:cytochrome c oxidase subunit II [Sutterellaceae bacterium]MBA4314897.1 cytochrome c oxidase subunit II [Alcaligenaceae bacterium]PZO13644.1 MAG: cytochrome c oxidase subunit II [Betaproteobacteria bacterium]QJR30808.1 cytochrome c oxidase subunit II [Limnobacter sp. SAORIC-580]RZO93425.1 MAG: cytochrome c oxidase subunit II [Limnobacter sp.]|tara:strand:+ start:3029 stop:4204 length:1176 start_codon:yes stop_codon:yes gene_type:complete
MLKSSLGIRKAVASAAAIAMTSFGGAAFAENVSGQPLQYNLAEPVTEIARQIYDLHTLMLVICLVIFVAVFGVMFYSIYAHRKSKGAKSASFHESVKVEIAWTIVPFLIVIGMALPATKTVVAMKDTSNADLTIKATGYQWKWGYEYLAGEGEGIAFLSTLTTPRDQIDDHQGQAVARGENYLMEVDNHVVVPVNKKVRVVTTANDVIHAWMIPAFGVKQDAIPGFVRDTWFKAEKEGIYRGQCAELCGKDHAYMPIVVEVMSEENYSKWVQAKLDEMKAKQDDPTKEWTKEDMVARGEQVYNANCAACHQASGEGIPGAFPSLVAAPSVVGPQADQIAILLNGKGAGMPAWKQLSDVEIASVITYTRNAWANAGTGTDPVVQPSAVTAAR